GRDDVPADGSFFGLGGDSIMSMLLVSHVRKAGLAITVRQVFEHQTPAALAAVATEATTGPTAAVDSPVGEVPLTPAMHELLDRTGAAAIGPVAQTSLLVVPAGLTGDALAAALGRVADRHDMLRARLEVVPERRLLVPEPGGAAPESWLRRVGASADPAGQTEAAISRLDPVAGVMVQVVWFDRGPDTPGRLLLAVHHLVADAVSLRVLVGDLAAAYAGTPLPPAPVPFRHWARSLAAEAVTARRRAELPLWRRLLAGPPPPERIDPARDVASTLREVTVSVPVPVTGALLTTAPAAFHAGVDDLLLAGLAAAVTEWRRTRGRAAGGGVLIDRERHGRAPDGPDLSRTVGWFTSVQPVRLDPGPVDLAEVRAGGPAAGDAVKRIKEQLRAVPGDGHGHGLLRRLDPESAPVLAELPSPGIGFNYLGRVGGAATGTREREWTPAGEGDPSGGGAGDHPVMHALETLAVVRERPDGPELTLVVAWPERSLPERDARALADGWAAMLTGLAGHTTAPGGGGHTPSDFLLAGLDQSQIDDLENELADERGTR
ncbi:condensation domain-containing protein, partial [Actinoplanes sp. NPDC051851]|uniref:condensation domain-containing protein n=1 Tax=Actinoplanes sp. NPDC051851 TaxID=3154753 RepID=UPI003428AB3D